MTVSSVDLSSPPVTCSKKRKYPGDHVKENRASKSHLFPLNGTTLDLTLEKDFGLEECTALAGFLASDQGHDDDSSTTNGNSVEVAELLLGRVGIGPLGGRALAEALKFHRTIVHLDLERNGLGALGGCAIFRALVTNKSLRKVNTSLNDIKAATTVGNDEATKAIGDALAENTTLEELLLVRSGLGPKGGNHLASGLSRNTSLVLLDLEGNDVMADGGQAIGEALKSNERLKHLNLRWNRIGCGGDRGIESLADALKVNRSLQKLDMSVNELYSEGAVVFGSALAGNQSLLELSLERNEIGTTGAAAIAQALGSNTILERLVLSRNPMMGDAGAVAIGQSLSENVQSSLLTLELVDCGVGVDGARAIGKALQTVESSIVSLRLEKNRIGPTGCAAIASGLEQNESLQNLNLSRNGLQAEGGNALAMALRKNRTLRSLNISYNDIEINNSIGDVDNPHIVESIADHPSLQYVDLSDNALEIIPIDCQLKLAKLYQTQRELSIDLSDNPLSSPPLGRKANVEGLKAYLIMLLSESTAVNRIRLMVLGFGGVGKSTFCDAVTQSKESLPYFHGSLVPLEEWDLEMIASWARRLGTHWAPFIASVLEANQVTGKDLPNLIRASGDEEDCNASEVLKDLVEKSTEEEPGMNASELKCFVRAIESLMRKGYFSTVGAVKLDGLLELDSVGDERDVADGGGCRSCSLVDFAGQMEYLVSHQLLLSSLHTLCVVLQPAPSFVYSQSRHSGSWMYWSRFLRALGDRRKGSLLLAISQLDKVTCALHTGQSEVNAAIEDEVTAIRSRIPNISDDPPLRLEYRPESIQTTIANVRKALSNAASMVARDWWVPASYEKLAELVRRLEDEKKANREVPIVSRKELHNQLLSVGLDRMHRDPQLFQRGIDYLEAVGDVMADHRLDCLLLDPISWFASFLAHFIRDDDIVTSVQLDARFVNRGMVTLEDVVKALQHDYSKPKEQVEQVMSLVCGLELCILYGNHENHGSNLVSGEYSENGNRDSGSVGVSYLFPCLLPPATAGEIAAYWPIPDSDLSSLVYRGYRFRSISGFFPPGLFPGLLARCRLLRTGVMSSERMWKNCAILVFTTNMRVMLRIEDATLDIVAVGFKGEDLFVGGAKGQASVVIWMTHVVKMFLRKSYPQLILEESFLCPSAECNGIQIELKKSSATTTTGEKNTAEVFHLCKSYYCGSEFPAVPKSGKQHRGDHNCEADGCWNQLGTGHKIEAMMPKTMETGLLCTNCHQEAKFALRS